MSPTPSYVSSPGLGVNGRALLFELVWGATCLLDVLADGTINLLRSEARTNFGKHYHRDWFLEHILGNYLGYGKRISPNLVVIYQVGGVRGAVGSVFLLEMCCRWFLVRVPSGWMVQATHVTRMVSWLKTTHRGYARDLPTVRTQV